MLKSLVKKWYYWFWHDVCKRPEPFTHTWRKTALGRAIIKHPKLFIGIPTGVGVTYFIISGHLAGWW